MSIPSYKLIYEPVEGHASKKVQLLATPIKSENDQKLYKTIRLENGLTALLISDVRKVPTNSTDPEAGLEYDEGKVAACAVSVGVGSFSDPPDIPGLAHFTEHLLFMGTKKYPEENQFREFISNAGGHSNAMTDVEETTYYFWFGGVEHLFKGMDMVSQFFISPIMSKDVMQREREAIDSEFVRSEAIDANRQMQLVASLFPEGHPARVFTWGNLRSLRDEVDSDERLHCELHKFVRRHYSAHRMTLTVQASLNMTTLTKYVVDTFGQVPNNALPPDDFSSYAFKADKTITPAFRSLYYVKPISDTMEVSVRWLMEPLTSKYQTQSHEFIYSLIRNRSKGSLYDYLRKKVWAMDVRTGNAGDISDTSVNSIFVVKILLTKEGLDHVDEVLEAMFSYITMLTRNGANIKIFYEFKTIADNSFLYDKEVQPENVKLLASKMRRYPPEHYITGGRIYYKFDPRAIEEVLVALRPELANIMVMSSKYTVPIKYNAKEKWFGTEYKREDIPLQWRQRWWNAEPYPEFHIPYENIYIATDFTIIPPAAPYVETATNLGLDLENMSLLDIWNKARNRRPRPKLFKKDNITATVPNFRLDQPNIFRTNDDMEVWYKQDFKWRTPTALIYLYFITALNLHTPKESCLLDLWKNVLEEGVKAETYAASVAQLFHVFKTSQEGIVLQTMGYSEKLPSLVETLTNYMPHATEDLSPEYFEAVRAKVSRTYHELLMEPSSLATEVRSSILLEPYAAVWDKAAWVRNVTLAHLQDFGQRFLKQIYMMVLVQGNIPWYEAITIAERVRQNLNWETTYESKPMIRVRMLPLGERLVRVKSFNKFSTKSVVSNFYQGDVATPVDRATVSVLMSLMREPLFDALRTQEQLGYVVANSLYELYGTLGFGVDVITGLSTEYVESRVANYLKIFLKNMQLPSTNPYGGGYGVHLVGYAHLTDFILRDEVERHWEQIINYEYDFIKPYRDADVASTISLLEIKDWVQRHYIFNNKLVFRKLSVQVVGKTANDKITADDLEPAQMTDFKLTFLKENDTVVKPGEYTPGYITNINKFKDLLAFII